MSAHPESPLDTRDETAVLRDGKPVGTDQASYEKAVDLVEAGYKAILGAFNVAKDRGVIPRGRVLAEMISSGDWTVPPLLDAEKFVEFQRLTNQYRPEGILPTVWYIIEHVCDGPRFIPAITIERESGHVVVVLAV